MSSEDPTSVEVTVLMPCLDEAESLATCIRKAQGALERHGLRGEVLIADNGSRDGSPQIAKDLGARVVAVPERGYGSALRGGIRAARGEFVIMGDADDSYDFSELMPFVEKLREGHDLVMGNRFRGGVAPGAMPPLHRYLGNPVLTALGRLFFKSPVGDFHAGMRGFRRSAIEALELRCSGMEFASEMVVKATLHGLRIAEVPIRLSPDGRSRAPHLRTWRDGWRHLRFLLLYSPRWLFLVPGLALIGSGLALGGALLFGELRVGDVVLDVNTLVYAAAAIFLGVQSVVFATFTKVFAIRSGLLREDARIERFVRVFTLERGLALGAALVVAGLVGSGVALGGWGAVAFGDLDPRESLRVVVPSVTALVIGFQIALSSFFLSVLGLASRER